MHACLRGPSNLLILHQILYIEPDFSCLADEIAEQRPDINIPGQAILVRKVNIHAYSMYVLFTDKVSCPMTQHYDPGDSQISNPWIPSLTLYELSHYAS